LKSRNYPQAIQSFEYALKQNGGDSIAEDAAFWLAVSYSYSGRKTDAEKAYASFLRGFPASARVGEASVALGWVLFERGDLTGAGALFSTAKNDRVTKVRESALKGLEAIEYRSAPAKPSVQ
jgi:TolA-binding protein